jgi:hypothetical protein
MRGSLKLQGCNKRKEKKIASSGKSKAIANDYVGHATFDGLVQE